MPDDWTLPDDWRQWAIDQGLTPAQVRIEADKFADFWHSKPGKDARKVDWQATWRNWIRRTLEGRKGNGKPQGNDLTQRNQETLAGWSPPQ